MTCTRAALKWWLLRQTATWERGAASGTARRCTVRGRLYPAHGPFMDDDST